MVKDELIPSRLVDPADRRPVIILEAEKPHRFRNPYILGLFLKLAVDLLWLRFTGRLTGGEAGLRFRELFEILGGLWIKIGQLLATRVDIFSVEFCQELVKLQDEAFGFSPAVARAIIEEGLGASLDRYFDEFDEHPFKAASVGQLHRAHLRHENVWVVVKVQRPTVARTIANDLKLIDRIGRFLEFFSIYPYLRWRETLAELRRIVNEELDYRFEAAGIRRLKKTLRRHKIYVPKVFSRYNTSRVLVLEFIHGALVTDYIEVFRTDPAKLTAWLEENNIDPQLVARRLIHSLFRQLFEDNLYHGQLYSGNIILLRNSRIAFIDFGSIGMTDKEYLEKLRLFMSALATRDYSKAADLTFLLGGTLPLIDVERAKADLVRMLRSWGTRTHVRELPYEEKSIDNAMIRVTKIMFHYRCTLDWQFLRVRRGLATLDSSLITLLPDADYTKLIQQYFRKAEKRALRSMLGMQIIPRLLKSSTTAMAVTDSIYEHSFYQGAIIRRQAQVFEGTTSKFAYFFAILAGQVALAELIAGAVLMLVFLYQHHGIEPLLGEQISRIAAYFPHLGYQIWIGILLLDVYFCITSFKLRKRFAQREVGGRDTHTSII